MSYVISKIAIRISMFHLDRRARARLASSLARLSRGEHVTVWCRDISRLAIASYV